jgi:predicted nuclease of predicted toxin-antitoxin system
MARTIRFHLDEHVATAVADGLRRLGIDVTTSADARLLGAPDHAQIAFALANARVIFTQDEDFLALAAQGVQHVGIVCCHQQTRSLGDIVRALHLPEEVYEPEEMRNRTEFI